MAKKVNSIITNSFAAINFFLLIGYINKTVIVLSLNSEIMSSDIRAAAKIINVPLTNVSITKNDSVIIDKENRSLCFFYKTE